MNRVRNATAVAVLALVALTFGLSPKAGAQPSQKQLDLVAAKADQKALVGANMSLTPDESAKFWPLYEQYEAAMEKVEERHIKEVKDFAQSYDSLTEADAQKKLDEVIAIQQARLDTQKEYIPKFRAVLNQIKVTRFFQIDNKLHALVQAQIAQMVPLAKEAGAKQ